MITTRVDVRIDAPLLRDERAVARAVERFMRAARVVLAQDEAERFRTATAPDGTPWRPLSPNTQRKSILKAIEKVGGRAARPIVQRTRTGGLVVKARVPQTGFQRQARVRRTRQSRILLDTGRLRNSVVAIAASADAIRSTERGTQRVTLVWGTRVPYAAAHQHGAPERNLPARPFLGVSEQALARLRQTMSEVLNAR